MKRNKMIALFLVLLLLVSGCAAQKNPQAQNIIENATEESTSVSSVPSSTEPIPDSTASATGEETDEGPAETTEAKTSSLETETSVPTLISSAFTELFPACPEEVLAVIYNAPFVNGPLDATVSWEDGEYDRLYIIPRYVGSTVSASALSFTEDGEMQASPVYSAVAEDGTVIYSSLSRPEGMPAWRIEVQLPDGTAQDMILDYNGRTGTPYYEFISEEPDQTDEFVRAVYDAQIIALRKADLNSFSKAAELLGMSTYDAAVMYFSQLTEIGDGASFTLSYGHEMDGDTYEFQIARFHSSYFTEGWDLNNLVKAQYDRYHEIGNEGGILGPDYTGELPELNYQLTGLTVFNRFLAAKEIEVIVNGESAGTYTLERDSFCTLIRTDLPEVTADSPITVQIKILSTYFGTAQNAWIDVYGGIAGTISNAI